MPADLSLITQHSGIQPELAIAAIPEDEREWVEQAAKDFHRAAHWRWREPVARGPTYKVDQ